MNTCAGSRGEATRAPRARCAASGDGAPRPGLGGRVGRGANPGDFCRAGGRAGAAQGDPGAAAGGSAIGDRGSGPAAGGTHRGGFRRRGDRHDAGADVRASLERVSPASMGAATALVAVIASAEPGSAELWVIDRVTGKTVVRRV